MPASKSDSLRRYRDKRSQDRTPEPFGRGRSGSGRLFVVQHHAARQLHYDFRIELDGVLVSWAVPRGPSSNPADKRLAVHVEDHPLEYADFEGFIPEGNYGAGAVIVWDRGSWQAHGDPREGMDRGKLLFDLNGYKLRGRWTLVKTRRGDKDWLFIKERDQYVSENTTEDYAADSIFSGLTVAQLKGGDDPEPAITAQIPAQAAKRHLRAGDVKPMLAQSAEPFSDADWVYEIKYDGYRLIVTIDDGTVQLTSRNGHDLTATFPDVAEAVSRLPYSHLVLDAEVVVHDPAGLPSFGLLQKRGRLTRTVEIQHAAMDLPAVLYTFDLLGFAGRDLRRLALTERKKLLRQLLPSAGPVRYSEHIAGQGVAMYEQAGRMGLEGVVAKRAESVYRSGRSPNWKKIPVRHSDDFAIVGYSDSKTGSADPASLLLAQFDASGPVFVGKVGTGFKVSDLRELVDQLQRIAAAPPPPGAPDDRNCHWHAPELVAEVSFKERTADGLLRQPVFERLRDDKRAAECLLHADEPARPTEVQPAEPERHYTLTNLDKVFWPADGYTKGELIAYYEGIAPWLLPYLHDRPLVMTRYPDGIDGKSFFQKDAPVFTPDWIHTRSMWSEDGGREIRYFIADDVDTLRYIINLGCIPLHVWSSRLDSLERPDWCILDLDPKGAPFAHVVRIAADIGRLCREIELPAFIKTSGSTGLHILIPLGRQYTYEQSRNFAQVLAHLVAAEASDIATVTRSVSQREGKVYVDYLQNGHGRLLVSAFSARPLPGAPVSMPIKWTEVNRGLDIGRYTIANARRRMQRLKADPVIDVLETSIDLNRVLQHLSERLAARQSC